MLSKTVPENVRGVRRVGSTFVLHAYICSQKVWSGKKLLTFDQVISALIAMLLKAFSLCVLNRFGAGVVLRKDNKGRDGVPGGPMWLHGPLGREGPGLI